MNSDKKPAKVTIFDVAAEAQVSKSTVSLVLTNSDKVSDVRKQRVLAAMDKLGYVYNRGAAALRSKRSNLVAVVINDLTNPYSAQLAVGLEKHIYSLGLVPMLVNSGECVQRQQDLIKTLKEYNVRAYIMVPAPNTTRESLDQLIAEGTPVITMMREVAFASAPCVLPDNQRGCHLATNYLIEQGHTQLAFIGGNDGISDFAERLNGFNTALAAHQLSEAPVIPCPTTRAGGRDAFHALRGSHQISAIVCFNDVVAYGVIEAMTRVGIIPGKDIKVVGFDDLDDSQMMQPALTTVRVAAEDIGKRVCDALADMLNGTPPAARTLVGVSLKIRDSA